jgi:hypothetical protein
MSRRRKTHESSYVDNARERFMMTTYMSKLKDIALFLFVTVVLTWLILGVF